MNTHFPLGRGLVVALPLLFLITSIIGGGSFAPDVNSIRNLQEFRETAPRVTMAVIGLTQFGSLRATIGAGLGVALWLAWSGERRRAMILAGTALGERVLLDGLKLLFDRARPALDAHPVLTHSSSFPSGHSGNSMAVFLAIALIAVPERWRIRAAVLAVMMSIAVGLTRPYLGVHWPTDVIGGWSFGAMIALGAAYLANGVTRDRSAA